MRSWLRAATLGMAAASFVALLSGCARPLDPSAAAQFRQAQQAFDQAASADDFLHAAALYQELVERDIRSGAIFYNQGNAYMRAGQRGRAIACYRQALRYRPTDPQLHANLRYATESVAVTRRKPLIEYLLFWQDWISYPGKFQLSLACALVAFAAGLVALVARTPAATRLAVVGLLVTLAACGSAAYDWYRFEYRRHGVLVRNDVTARKGNAESYAPAFTTPLMEGTEFEVREIRGDWLRIALPAGLEGWVRRDDVVVY